jgi:hypothetical protein
MNANPQNYPDAHVLKQGVNERRAALYRCIYEAIYERPGFAEQTRPEKKTVLRP